jgi:hypothetical protein
MTRFRSEILNRLDRLERCVDQISRSIEKIEVATIVRDPSSALSIEAYDGLRRQVITAASERMAHLVQLVNFAEAVGRAGADELVPLVEEWLTQADVERVPDATDARYYDVLGGAGSEVRMLRVAYRDGKTGRPVQMGQIELVTLEPDGSTPPNGRAGDTNRHPEPTQEGSR